MKFLVYINENGDSILAKMKLINIHTSIDPNNTCNKYIVFVFKDSDKKKYSISIQTDYILLERHLHVVWTLLERMNSGKSDLQKLISKDFLEEFVNSIKNMQINYDKIREDFLSNFDKFKEGIDNI